MKTCFKCNMALPLSEFYKHPRMADGLLGKCKACTRKDVAGRVSLKSATDLEWVLAERERHRLKAIRQRKTKEPAPRSADSTKKYRQRNPLKWAAHCIVNNAISRGRMKREGCEKCGGKAHAHHDDYLKPMEVRWLCPKHHGEHHRMIRNEEIKATFYK